jgi:hypothetical protein
MIEGFISMYAYTEMQCFVGEKPDFVPPKKVVEVYIEPIEEVVEEIDKPVYHMPKRIPSIKSFTREEWVKSVFNPAHPRHVKTNHEGIQ